jgi:hypothetical protein
MGKNQYGRGYSSPREKHDAKKLQNVQSTLNAARKQNQTTTGKIVDFGNTTGIKKIANG